MILVVGGAGYIGSHVNRRLHRDGRSTAVLDNLVHGHQELVRWGTLETGDLANHRFLNQVFQEHRISAVMHLAAFAYVGESVEDPQKYYLNNVAGTLSLLQAMIEHDVKDIVFSSSCTTYGVPEEMPISEDHPQNPISPYGRSKVMVERILEDYSRAYGLRYVTLRYFNAAGADSEGEIGEWHEPETHLIPLALDVALGRAERLSIFGRDYPTTDGTCVRDYIHVSDIADAHVLALEYLQRGEASGAFNLGNGMGFSVLDVIGAVERVTGQPVATADHTRRAGDPAALLGSSKKAENLLGWRRRICELDAIIQTAWVWHKKLHTGLSR